MQTVKHFRWYDSWKPEQPRLGPYHTFHADLIGRKVLHTQDELLKLDLSDTIKKRIKSAKENTSIRIHYLHNCGDLYIQRVSENFIDAFEQSKCLDEAVADVKKEIKTHIPASLLKKQKDLEKLRKENKKEQEQLLIELGKKSKKD